MKALFFFILILAARFPTSHGLPKYPEICGNEHMSTLFCCDYFGKFPHSLKSSVNGICSICHFLQVWFLPQYFPST